MHGEREIPDITRLLEEVDRSDIATIKRVVAGILRIINDPRATIEQLKELIEVDPPLAAKVLRTANSAYYSSGRRINEIEQAVIWIGFDELKEIVLHQSVLPIFSSHRALGKYSRALLWKHCVSVAVLGKMIYRKEFAERGENMYAVGLLHDIGVIVEDQLRNRGFAQVVELTQHEGIALVQAEERVLGFNHAQVGRALALRWNFPPDFAGSIGSHHDSFGVPQDYARMDLVLYISNALSHSSGIGRSGLGYIDEEAVRRCMDALALEQVSLELIVDDLRKTMTRLEKQEMV